MVVQKLSDLSQNEAFLKMSVEELNGDLKRKTAPLETEAGQTKKRLEEIEGEIGRYVKALGQGKLSIERLEAEIDGLEADKQSLRRQYDDLQRKINETAARDYNAEILQRTGNRRCHGHAGRPSTAFLVILSLRQVSFNESPLYVSLRSNNRSV